MKWEYYKVPATEEYEEGPLLRVRWRWPDEESLDRIGEDGWELVCTLRAMDNDPPYLLFKRPLDG